MSRQSDASHHRYGALDAWRGICACLVTVVHIPVAHPWQQAVAFHNMQLFVDFFFVLSGFVIFYAYGDRVRDRASTMGFVIRRFGRVWPLHAAVLAGFVALEVVKAVAGAALHLPLDGAPFSDNHSIPSLLSNLALTQAFNLHGMTTWNGPAWSIGVEFYTYLVFAAAVLLFGTRPAIFAALAMAGLLGVAAFSEAWLFTTHDFGFFRCLYGFFTGVLVSMLVRREQAGGRASTKLEIAAIGIMGLYIAVTGTDVTSLAAPLIFALLVYVFAFEGGVVSRLLKGRAAQALGLWSYSIYMVHMLLFAVLKIVFTVAAKFPGSPLTAPVSHPVKLWSLGSPLADAALAGFELAAVIALASLSYRYIEAPARAWFSALASEAERPAAVRRRPAATFVQP